MAHKLLKIDDKFCSLNRSINESHQLIQLSKNLSFGNSLGHNFDSESKNDFAKGVFTEFEDNPLKNLKRKTSSSHSNFQTNNLEIELNKSSPLTKSQNSLSKLMENKVTDYADVFDTRTKHQLNTFPNVIINSEKIKSLSLSNKPLKNSSQDSLKKMHKNSNFNSCSSFKNVEYKNNNNDMKEYSILCDLDESKVSIGNESKIDTDESNTEMNVQNQVRNTLKKDRESCTFLCDNSNASTENLINKSNMVGSEINTSVQKRNVSPSPVLTSSPVVNESKGKNKFSKFKKPFSVAEVLENLRVNIKNQDSSFKNNSYLDSYSTRETKSAEESRDLEIDGSFVEEVTGKKKKRKRMRKTKSLKNKHFLHSAKDIVKYDQVLYKKKSKLNLEKKPNHIRFDSESEDDFKNYSDEKEKLLRERVLEENEIKMDFNEEKEEISIENLVSEINEKKHNLSLAAQVPLNFTSIPNDECNVQGDPVFSSEADPVCILEFKNDKTIEEKTNDCSSELESLKQKFPFPVVFERF